MVQIPPKAVHLNPAAVPERPLRIAARSNPMLVAAPPRVEPMDRAAARRVLVRPRRLAPVRTAAAAVIPLLMGATQQAAHLRAPRMVSRARHKSATAATRLKVERTRPKRLPPRGAMAAR